MNAQFTTSLFQRISLLSILALLTAAGCNCPGSNGDDGLNALDSQIRIQNAIPNSNEICNEESWECEVNLNQEVSQNGELVVLEGVRFDMMVTNPGRAPLKIQDIYIDDNDGAWSLETQYQYPLEVDEEGDAREGSLLALPLRVLFQPVEAGSSRASLFITSNASNGPESEIIEIKFEAEVTDNGAPEIEVSPAECNFGAVGIGASATCDIAIQNVGVKPLIINGLSLEAIDDPRVFSLSPETIIQPGESILPGTGRVIRMIGVPPTESDYENAIFIESNDPDEQVTRVPLLIEGANAPTAVPQIWSINGLNTTSDADLNPRDDIRITGIYSVPSNAANEIVDYQWELLEKPDGSSVELSATSGQQIGFTYNSAGLGIPIPGFPGGGGRVPGIDLAGTYTIKLTVTDDIGLVSTNAGTLSFSAIPGDALYVQMSWDTDRTDMDLWLYRDNDGSLCPRDQQENSQTYCYWSNCTDGTDFDADGTICDPEAAGECGDAFLDIDNVSGYGPENINIESPIDGVYDVAVNYFGGSGSTTNLFVKVFINGALRLDLSNRVVNSKDVWNVARIDWSAGDAIITTVNTVSQLPCN